MARGTVQQAMEQAKIPHLTREVVREIQVEVAQDERNHMAKDLSAAVVKHNLLVDERTSTNSALTKRIKKQAGVMEELAKIVDEGLRTDEVQCVQEFDERKMLVQVIRKSSGGVIEEWRPATKDEAAAFAALREKELEERQLTMPDDLEPEGEDEGGEPEGADLG